MDEEIGQLLKYRQLNTHTKFAHIWNQSYSNKMARLCQGVVTGLDGTGKRFDSTDTFHVTHYEYIPQDRRK